MTTFVCFARSATPPRRRTILRSSSSSHSKVGMLRINNEPFSWINVGWKRLLLADGPRQSINALNLYGFYLSKEKEGSFFDLKKYSDNFITSALIVATLFTVLVFVLSSILLITAGICYIPLLCYIRGNLKEYCCHKVDKVCVKRDCSSA